MDLSSNSRQIDDGKSDRESLEQVRFDQFPHGYLTFKVSRRKLLPALLNNLHQFTSDVPTYGLAELGIWEDEKLGEVIPKVTRESLITLEKGIVYSSVSGSEIPVQLFTVQSPALMVFNGMNGRTSLSQIAAQLTAERGWEPDYSFNFTRGVFLWLVLCRVCEPLYPKPPVVL